MEISLIPILVIAILAVSVLAGWLRLRSDPGKARGAMPRKGDHVLSSDYQSGLGGHATTWRVPADPQEYAKKFVPPARK